MRDTDEEGGAQRTGDGVERCHDGRAVGVEIARQGVEAVGLGHHGCRSRRREEPKQRGQPPDPGSGIKAEPHAQQADEDEHRARQDHESPASPIQQRPEHRHQQCLDDAARQQDESGDGRRQHEHLLGVHGHEQLHAQEQEDVAGHHDDGIAELCVAESPQVQQRRLQTELTDHERSDHQQGYRQQHGQLQGGCLGKRAAPVDQPAKAQHRQHDRQQIDAWSRDLDQGDFQVTEHQQDSHQHQRHGQQEQPAPAEVVDDEA